jgi:hypothetical protein
MNITQSYDGSNLLSKIKNQVSLSKYNNFNDITFNLSHSFKAILRAIKSLHKPIKEPYLEIKSRRLHNYKIITRSLQRATQH